MRAAIAIVLADNRIHEERPDAAGVGIVVVEHHALAAANRQHRRPRLVFRQLAAVREGGPDPIAHLVDVHKLLLQAASAAAGAASANST